MNHHVLVAEAHNGTWKSISHGIRCSQPEAAILRVKDGEQAMRFLFQQGLMTEEPETPRLIVLNSELPLVPINAVMARIRQHPRTKSIPVIVVSADESDSEVPGDSQLWLHRRERAIVVRGTKTLEKEIVEAMHLLREGSLELDSDSD